MAILLAALVVSSIQDCGGGSSSITNRYVVFILNEKIHLFSCATCIVSDMWSSKCLSSCQSKESNVSESQCTYKTVLLLRKCCKQVLQRDGFFQRNICITLL